MVRLIQRMTDPPLGNGLALMCKVKAGRSQLRSGRRVQQVQVHEDPFNARPNSSALAWMRNEEAGR
jgi:hypothetical protein